MNKTFTLSILVGLLILMNVSLIGFILMQNNHRPPQNREKDNSFIQKQFGFDDNQMVSFDKSKKKHIKSSEQLSKQLKDVSGAYYDLDLNNKEAKDSLMLQILKLSEQIYQVNDKHLQEVKSICSPDQVPDFNGFIKNLMGGGPQSKNGPPPRPRRK